MKIEVNIEEQLEQIWNEIGLSPQEIEDNYAELNKRVQNLFMEFLREQFEQHRRGLPAVGEDGAGGGAADGAQSIHPQLLLHRYDRDAGSNGVRFARLPELFRPAGVLEEKSGYCRVIPGAEPCDRFVQRLFEIDAGRGDSRLHLIGDRQ